MIRSAKIENLVLKYRENKLSHAFLFVTNDIVACEQDLLEFIKRISCPKYEENCDKCNICYQISHDDLPNIVKIRPDGQYIKKGQILELKDRFKGKPIFLENNFYFIENAEKLNASSGNTMLKFLEEPEDNIIGFFLTNNKEGMLDTIKSRLQIITVVYDESLKNNLALSDSEIENYRKVLLNYFADFPNEDLLVLNKTYLSGIVTDRLSFNSFFIYFYSLLGEHIKRNSKEFMKRNFSISQLNKMRNIIYELLESSTFNVNIELLLDQFAMAMEDLNEI